ncbi:hypothetical protein RB1474 [Rhodopirellula baltica SH 1]|uniref:Uncharacterized protein n=1 Tax=Rhodopirellula baltica (strain DSM 10527 / NCIMB 13988 / SH1) TaxID=243090 RepID=Q7UX98_RHOBA|nr:hypothetical protein RB1474 [Rhodopirellula baltica SH 1]
MGSGAHYPPPEISLNALFPTPPAARAGFSRLYLHSISKLHPQFTLLAGGSSEARGG